MAVPRGGARHPRRLHGARRAGGQRQRQLLQRDRRAARFRRRRRSRMVGLLDRRRATTPRSGSRARATSIVLLGRTREELGGSEYLARRARHGARHAAVDRPRRSRRRCSGSACRRSARAWCARRTTSREGGLAVALAECCISGPGEPLGAEIEMEAAIRPDALAVRREPVAHRRVACAASTSAACASWRAPPTCRCTVLGEVRGRRLRIGTPDRRQRRASCADVWADGAAAHGWRRERGGDAASRIASARSAASSASSATRKRPTSSISASTRCSTAARRAPASSRRTASCCSRTAASGWSPTSSTQEIIRRLERHDGDRPQPLLDRRPHAAEEHAAVRRRVRRAAGSRSRTTATWSTPPSCASSSRRAARSSSRSVDTEVIVHLIADADAASASSTASSRRWRRCAAPTRCSSSRRDRADRRARSERLPAAGARAHQGRRRSSPRRPARST